MLSLHVGKIQSFPEGWNPGPILMAEASSASFPGPHGNLEENAGNRV